MVVWSANKEPITSISSVHLRARGGGGGGGQDHLTRMTQRQEIPLHLQPIWSISRTSGGVIISLYLLLCSPGNSISFTLKFSFSQIPGRKQFSKPSHRKVLMTETRKINIIYWVWTLIPKLSLNIQEKVTLLILKRHLKKWKLRETS